MSKSKYYLAFQRLDYEGINENSLKLFIKRAQAEKYIENLKEIHGDMNSTFDIQEKECEDPAISPRDKARRPNINFTDDI